MCGPQSSPNTFHRRQAAADRDRLDGLTLLLELRQVVVAMGALVVGPIGRTAAMSSRRPPASQVPHLRVVPQDQDIKAMAMASMVQGPIPRATVLAPTHRKAPTTVLRAMVRLRSERRRPARKTLSQQLAPSRQALPLSQAANPTTTVLVNTHMVMEQVQACRMAQLALPLPSPHLP